jgi:uncharacterized protein
MSPGWSRRILVDTLVSTEAAHEFAIPLAELPRIAQQLAGTDGEASGVVRFSRQVGHAVADLRLKARPTVVCQRCMQMMRWPVDVETSIALVGDIDAADRVPEGLEVFVVEGDSVSVRELVDEEVMLALPTVPLHDEDSDCMKRFEALAAESVEDAEEADSQVQKPFAQLGELLKRK